MTDSSGNRRVALPPRDTAFVVHLTDAAGEQARGRVEHVRSGRTGHFDGIDELLRFMRQTLANLDR